MVRMDLPREGLNRGPAACSHITVTAAHHDDDDNKKGGVEPSPSGCAARRSPTRLCDMVVSSATILLGSSYQK